MSKPEKAPEVGPGRRHLLKLMAALPVAGLSARKPRFDPGGSPDQRVSARGQPREGYDPQQLNPYRASDIPKLETLIPDRKFIWADLRGFDNSAPGFGVEEYLGRLSFKPDAIFLLLSNPDFVFLHNSVSPDVPLEHRFVVYGGETLTAQTWSTFQLKGFIDEMHSAGVKVLASMFMMTSYGKQGVQGWFQDHPEVLTLYKDGTIGHFANPLKRLKAGDFFEDVFLESLAKTMTAWGFDGYHAADGSTHLSVPLSVADFSDDMVDQFLRHSHIELPSPYRKQAGCDVSAIRVRADWIWNEKKSEWIAFWRYRWAGFWRKVAKTCKDRGKMIVANQPWTMPPYEAIYRYGFDYKVLEEAKLDALVVETVAGPNQLGGYSPYVNGVSKIWLEDATAMVMCVRSYVPTLPLVFLLCVQDENEQWDTLRLAPNFLEKEIFSYCLTFYLNTQGTRQRCLDGFVVCLGVGLSKEEWARVGQTVARAFSISASHTLRCSGVTAVWSDQVMENQLKLHLIGRSEWPRPPLHSFMRNLSHEGAPIRTIVRIESVDKTDGPLLLVNSDDLGKTGLSKLLDRLAQGDLRRNIILICETLSDFSADALVIRDHPQFGKMQCGVVTTGKSSNSQLKRELSDKLKVYEPVVPDTPLLLDVDKSSESYFSVTNNEPVSWRDRVPYLPISHEFFSKAASAGLCIGHSGATSSHGRMFSLAEGEQDRYVVVFNDEPTYLWCRISVDRPISAFKLFSFPFPRRPTLVNDTVFNIKISPNGIAVMELETRQPPETRA
jgi:hypothetical protein